MTLPRLTRHTFVEFLERDCQIALTLAQRVLWLVACGEAQPRDFDGEEREIARQLFGPGVDEIPAAALRRVALVKGRAIGGTRIAAMRLIDLALSVPLSLAPGEKAFAICVSPDLKTSQQALNFIIGAFDASARLARCEVGRNASSLQLRRADGHTVSLETLAASRGGSSTRGRSLVGVVFDESAFFRSEEAAISDLELFKAVMPRLVLGGQALVVSSPWLPEGLLHSMFTSSYGNPTTTLAIHAPTALLRSDSQELLEEIEAQALIDPEATAREFHAEFLAGGSSRFFDANAIDAAIDEALVVPRSTAGGRVCCAVDPGFTRDSATFAAVEVDESGIVTILCLDELRPQKGSPLAPSVVLERWASLAKGYGVRSMVCDVHYRELVREEMGRHQIALEAAPEGQRGKAAMYEATRLALNEGRLHLPNHRRLLGQLREVISKPTPGGGMSISSPRKNGGHGDLVSALVAAVHQAVSVPAVEYSYTPVRVARKGRWDGSRFIAEHSDDDRDDDDFRCSRHGGGIL